MLAIWCLNFIKKHSVILSTELLWAARTYFVIMLTPIAHHDKSKAKERILKLKQNKKKRNHSCLHIVRVQNGSGKYCPIVASWFRKINCHEVMNYLNF